MGSVGPIVVLGRAGYDLYAVEQARLLPDVEHFSRHLGGSSANIAVGLARQHVPVELISCLGNDALATYLLRFLTDEGVGTTFVRLVDGYGTSLCLIEVSRESEPNQVFYRHHAADSQIALQPAERLAISTAQGFVTNGTSLSRSPARDATMEALEIARAAHVRTVFDMDYRSSSWHSPLDAADQARRALTYVDITLANERELEILVGDADPVVQAKTVLRSGVELLVRKCGPSGVVAYTHDSCIALAAYPARPLCTVGAGDGFAVGLLSGLYRGLDLPDCLEYGNAAAACLVEHVSCSDSMPVPAELEEYRTRGRLAGVHPISYAMPSTGA